MRVLPGSSVLLCVYYLFFLQDVDVNCFTACCLVSPCRAPGHSLVYSHHTIIACYIT